VVIYAYNHHVWRRSPEPMVVDKPQSTRGEEPTLLGNHLAMGLYAIKTNERKSAAAGGLENGIRFLQRTI
jgi:hypothetical protein